MGTSYVKCGWQTPGNPNGIITGHVVEYQKGDAYFVFVQYNFRDDVSLFHELRVLMFKSYLNQYLRNFHEHLIK